MRPVNASVRPGRVVPIALALLLAGASPGLSQQQGDTARFEIYGFAQTDMIYDFKQVDPLWFDVLRPTKLPAFDQQFGRDHNFWGSVRQSRFGVRTSVPTPNNSHSQSVVIGPHRVGIDAGQTTFRARHMYGELAQFGAGQTWSPFMDIDVFPNSLEYWGPNGMVFFRNVQFRWMPIKGDTRLTFALERPGATADQGNFADRIELENVRGRFPIPDLSGEYRYGTSWGYVELAGIVRYMKIDDLVDDAVDLNRSIVGGGATLSSNIRFNRDLDVVRLQLTYGKAIENYMNDAPVDVAVDENFGDPTRPIRGVGLPVFGLVAFLDHRWNDRFTSAIGYSMLDIDNSSGQRDDAFNRGHYALANLLYYPVKDLMVGGEFQWGRRDNFRDDFDVNDYRLQFSARYNFAFLSERRVPTSRDREKGP